MGDDWWSVGTLLIPLHFLSNRLYGIGHFMFRFVLVMYIRVMFMY